MIGSLRPRSIAVTGGAGFFGWHFRCHMRALFPSTEVRVIDQAAFSDDEALKSLLQGVNTVVHLAGANRGPADEVEETNLGLANRLVATLDQLDIRPTLVYANSAHAETDSAYGRSKRAAGTALAAWGHRTGADVADLRFPNLFGELGRPNYNSAVATFCHDVAAGLQSFVDPDGHSELLHVQDACTAVVDAISTGFNGDRRVTGVTIPIPALYQRLQRLRAEYQGASLPELGDPLDLRLFNTLRAALFPSLYPIRLVDHRDARGLFAELARGDGPSQTSVSTSGPGITRGNHFHLRKIERFVVLRGRAVISIRKLFTERVVRFEVSGDELVAVDMPTLHTHNITADAADGDLVTLFWANDHFDPAAPDTYPEPVRTSGVTVS